MALIRGEFRLRPVLLGAVELPALGKRRDVTFVLDTGSEFSVLHPFDVARLLDIDWHRTNADDRASTLARAIREQFPDGRRVLGAGIGGAASYIEAKSRLGFIDDTSGFEIFEQPLFIAVPDAANMEYPSLLGMDFLSAFDVRLNYSLGVVALEFIEVR